MKPWELLLLEQRFEESDVLVEVTCRRKAATGQPRAATGQPRATATALPATLWTLQRRRPHLRDAEADEMLGARAD